MKTRDIVLGLIVLIVLVLGVLWIKKVRTDRALRLQTTPSTEEKISNSFGDIQIPDDATKVELSDVSGGDGFGVATEDMVLADLPDPEAGTFYQVWIEKDGKLTSLGKMRIAKGGWLLEGNVSDKVIVSREKVFDSTLETKILEGSF
jgi:hypothetical protein